MKNVRGYALLLVLVGIAAALALGTLVGGRIDGDLLATRADEERLQALWLARSAVAQQKAGDREIAVRGGKAKVHATAKAGAEKLVEATVTTASGAIAQASAKFAADGTASGWQERFDRPSRPTPVAATVPQQ
ncbi:MAG TPA: hypothetical protein VGK67_23545 [Myxococcales bacterium]|jgi:hypothetical protein